MERHQDEPQTELPNGEDRQNVISNAVRLKNNSNEEYTLLSTSAKEIYEQANVESFEGCVNRRHRCFFVPRTF